MKRKVCKHCGNYVLGITKDKQNICPICGSLKIIDEPKGLTHCVKCNNPLRRNAFGEPVCTKCTPFQLEKCHICGKKRLNCTC